MMNNQPTQPEAFDRSAAVTRSLEANDLLAALEAVPIPARSADLGCLLRRSTWANGIAHARAELDWLDATEQQLDRVGP